MANVGYNQRIDRDCAIHILFPARLMLLTVPKSYWFWLAAFVAMACSSVEAMDHVTLRREQRTLSVDGRIVLNAQDGGLLFLARDGVLWRILPTEIIKHTTDDAPFRAYPSEQMTKSVMADLPKGFEVYQTLHYMIVYDTSRAYAQWCGTLFERLYMAFRNDWTHQGFEMVDPEFRLVAIIFSDKASYVKYSQKELGEAADSTFGYYNMESNRMIMYDLAGRGGEPPGTDHRRRPDHSVSRQPQRTRCGFDDRPRGDAPDRLQQRSASAVE